MSRPSTGLSRAERRNAATGGAPALFIYSYKEAAVVAGLGLRTLERLIAEGKGPNVVELSPMRRGISNIDLADWLKSKTRKAPTTAAASITAAE
jgi:hypothetical protein